MTQLNKLKRKRAAELTKTTTFEEKPDFMFTPVSFALDLYNGVVRKLSEEIAFEEPSGLPFTEKPSFVLFQ